MQAGQRPNRCANRGALRGVLLLGLLLAMAISGVALLLALDVWSVTRQRQQEQELLFVGEQYRMAIARYYYAAPKGAPRTLPATLQDLLQDDRYSIPMRHLRRLYPDPLTGAPQWGAVLNGKRIAGVYSLAKGTAVKQGGFAQQAQNFAGKSSYREWAFVFTPPTPVPTGRAERPATGAPAPGARATP